MRNQKPQMIPHRITAAAVDAYRRKNALKLHQCLGLKQWQVSPLHVDQAHGENNGTAWGSSFALARELRAALERGM